MSGELLALRDHALKMSKAQHRPDCLSRDRPWVKPTPRPGCHGCMTDAERALWKQIADEHTSYLKGGG